MGKPEVESKAQEISQISLNKGHSKNQAIEHAHTYVYKLHVCGLSHLSRCGSSFAQHGCHAFLAGGGRYIVGRNLCLCDPICKHPPVLAGTVKGYRLKDQSCHGDAQAAAKTG